MDVASHLISMGLILSFLEWHQPAEKWCLFILAIYKVLFFKTTLWELCFKTTSDSAYPVRYFQGFLSSEHENMQHSIQNTGTETDTSWNRSRLKEPPTILIACRWYIMLFPSLGKIFSSFSLTSHILQIFAMLLHCLWWVLQVSLQAY